MNIEIQLVSRDLDSVSHIVARAQVDNVIDANRIANVITEQVFSKYSVEISWIYTATINIIFNTSFDNYIGDEYIYFNNKDTLINGIVYMLSLIDSKTDIIQNTQDIEHEALTRNLLKEGKLLTFNDFRNLVLYIVDRLVLGILGSSAILEPNSKAGRLIEKLYSYKSNANVNIGDLNRFLITKLKTDFQEMFVTVDIYEHGYDIYAFPSVITFGNGFSDILDVVKLSDGIASEWSKHSRFNDGWYYKCEVYLKTAVSNLTSRKVEFYSNSKETFQAGLIISLITAATRVDLKYLPEITKQDFKTMLESKGLLVSKNEYNYYSAIITYRHKTAYVGHVCYPNISKRLIYQEISDMLKGCIDGYYNNTRPHIEMRIVHRETYEHTTIIFQALSRDILDIGINEYSKALAYGWELNTGILDVSKYVKEDIELWNIISTGKLSNVKYNESLSFALNKLVQ